MLRKKTIRKIIFENVNLLSQNLLSEITKQINEVQKFTDIEAHVYGYMYIFCKLDVYILHVYFIQRRLYV